MLRKIISGGQTGVDQAGLYAAAELGLQTGGWMPRGFRTDVGPNPQLAKRFGLKENASYAYPPRTLLNVEEADGTFIFGNEGSPGCLLTIRYCYELGKPYFLVKWPTALATPLFGPTLGKWVKAHNIEILNVAGNRESTNPGIFEAAVFYICETLKC